MGIEACSNAIPGSLDNFIRSILTFCIIVMLLLLKFGYSCDLKANDYDDKSSKR